MVLDPAMLEPAFVDDTKLLDWTVDEELGAFAEEDGKEKVPCLIARALSPTLEVVVTDFVEFFKLQ